VEIAQNAHVFAQQPATYPKATMAMMEASDVAARHNHPAALTIPLNSGCHVEHSKYTSIITGSKAIVD
jgi:hypothetical protein